MSSVNKDETGRNGGKGGKTGLIIGITIAVLIIIALAGVIIYLLASKSSVPDRDVAGASVEAPSEDDTQSKRSVVATAENAEEIATEMAQASPVEQGYYRATMSNEWHFKNGEAESEDAYVANVESNTNDVYFDVVLAEDEEQVLYESPVIPRGAELSHFALDTSLDAGSYDCVVIYHLVDEDQNTISTLRVTVTIVIEE